jgi:hypothetical protein
MGSGAPEIDLLSQYSTAQYLLWSGHHQKWWATDGWGYTDNRDEAGRFTCVVAVAHVLRSAERGDPEQVSRMVRDVPRE